MHPLWECQKNKAGDGENGHIWASQVLRNGSFETQWKNICRHRSCLTTAVRKLLNRALGARDHVPEHNKSNAAICKILEL